MKKILINTSSFGVENDTPLQLLRKNNFEGVINPYKRKLNESELNKLVDEHHPIGLLAGVEPITADILKNSKDTLKVISRVGVGWDNVDHEAAKKYQIKIFRTEGVLDQPVAELTIGFILNALRHISLHDRQIRQGLWKKNMGALLQGKNFGIIGYGAIGQKVGELAVAFGATVAYSDICEKDSACAICVTLDQLLKTSDIISIHASGCDEIFSAAELARCKKGAIIVNTARGGLIDENALFEKLQSGHIGYACLDVFENEPYTGPLTRLDNVLMTSHIGSYASEARMQMEMMAVENLLQGLKDLGEL